MISNYVLCLCTRGRLLTNHSLECLLSYSPGFSVFRSFYPFPKPQILDSSKLKEFADDNFKFDDNVEKFSKTIENYGKRRYFSLWTISNFAIVFSKDLYCRHVKTRACLGMEHNFWLAKAYSLANQKLMFHSNLRILERMVGEYQPRRQGFRLIQDSYTKMWLYSTTQIHCIFSQWKNTVYLFSSEKPYQTTNL